MHTSGDRFDDHYDPDFEYDLERFVRAQDEGATYTRALAELRTGRKTGHWMWFVFPQLAGLGRSPMAQRFAIASLEEARAYRAHPVLGARLREAAGVAVDADADFGGIDTVKLRSSATLFLRADPGDVVLQRVLDHYFGGVADPRTDELLAGGA